MMNTESSHAPVAVKAATASDGVTALFTSRPNPKYFLFTCHIESFDVCMEH
jgi:hypothetical protein